MKKKIAMLLIMMLVMTTFAGCGETSTSTSVKKSGKEDKISVVTTIFPEYDWVKEIVGDNENVDLTMLLANGVDLHSFQPTTEDIAKISTCDVFIYVGGESDGWVEDALSEAVNKDMKVINLLDVWGESVKEEEIVEGRQEEHEHGEHEEGEHSEDEHDADVQNEEEHSEDEHSEEEHEEEGPEYDEHVWLSLRNAQVLCEKIATELSSVDAENAQKYKDNVAAYKKKLAQLDEEYKKVVSDAKQKTVLFGDRFPFRYLVDDYGLDYYAAFVGCSAESEASFESIRFLSNKVDELGLHAILQIETADGSIANTIKENTKNKDQQILTMDSMQSTTAEEVEKGASYYNAMENNLEVLKEALK